MVDWGLIFGMLAVTYGVRVLPFAYAQRLRLPLWLQEALAFVPVAALTAIIAPIILLGEANSINVLEKMPYIIASLVAFCIAYTKQSLLWTVSIGMSSFYLLRFLVPN